MIQHVEDMLLLDVCMCGALLLVASAYQCLPTRLNPVATAAGAGALPYVLPVGAGGSVEAVLIPMLHRRGTRRHITLCVSSQVSGGVCLCVEHPYSSTAAWLACRLQH